MPTDAAIKFWMYELSTKLYSEFSRFQKVYLQGKGEIVNGDDIQVPCNRVFGLQPYEHVISEYGVAIMLKHNQLHIPLLVLGVSVKDLTPQKPLTFYRMFYSLRDKKWHYSVLHFNGDNTDFHDLITALDAEFKSTGEAMLKDNLPFE